MSLFLPKYETLVDLFQESVSQYADRPLFLSGPPNRRAMSYDDFGREVDRLRGGLATLGIEEGDRVGIVSINRPEWAVAAYATYGLGAAFVSMYDHQRLDEIVYILRDSGVRVVFVSSPLFLEAINAKKAELPELEHIISIDEPPVAGVLSYRELIERGTERPAPLITPKSSSVAAFIYTSGTTGRPKGVKLSHSNLASNVSALERVFPVRSDDRSLSILPWSHIFGQVAELHILFSRGASIAFSTGAVHLESDLKRVKPTVLITVPRILIAMMETIHERVAAERPYKQRVFSKAMENIEKRNQLARERRSSGMVDLLDRVFDRFVFERVRQELGGSLRLVVSGGAPLSREVAEFIDALGIPVYEGYGLTETSPIVATNYPGSRRVGTVGKPIPGVQVEIDTEVRDHRSHGEIIVFGHGVMLGYHGLEEENEAIFVERDGRRGIRTGDTGYFDGQGFLHLTGRVKEQYKLSNGKYVVPSALEQKLRESAFIDNLMVYGEGRDFNVALIVPNFEKLSEWAAARGLPTDLDSLIHHPEVRALYEREIIQHSGSFKGYEHIRRFRLVTEPFTPENGLLTPTLKIRREQILERYGDALFALYDERMNPSTERG